MNRNIFFLTLLFLGFCFTSKGQAPIAGPIDVCVGATITLTDATPGGTWASGATAVGTIGSITGIVTGVTPGTAEITYTVGIGSVTTTVTVHPNPAAIVGLSVVCAGATITMTDATGGGVWSSTNTGVATITGLGVVTGVSAGTTVISYTAGFCAATHTVSVNPAPAPVSGAGSLCVGSTITVTDATGGGTWSTSSGAIATVGSGTGIVTGVAFGTVTVSYTLSTGCYATATATVNVNPGPITGFKTWCSGALNTLADGGAGAWTSSNTAVATIDVVTGVASGVMTGTSVISYTFATGCYTTTTITIVDCANICPPNVDFEFGNYAFWNIFNGTLSTGPIYALVAGPPIVPRRENIMSGPGTDPYGGFPVVGSGLFSLRLGHDTSNRCAERARYFIHVPTGSTDYSLIYRYAVVFQDAGHTSAEQPRFEVNVYDSATGSPTPCAQYTYVASSVLPGFIHSTVSPNPWYHDWATSSINLSGAGGTTVTVDFTAADCSLGGHWGYGYVDMTCGLFGINTVSCNDSVVTLTAPSGFSSYSWYDSSTFAPLLGSTQTITLPMPTLPTTYAVIIQPYTGFGCPDTLYTHVIPTDLRLHKSRDTTICLGSAVTLTSGATDIALPLTYEWAPAGTLSCGTCATPLSTPTGFGSVVYLFTVTDAAGCHAVDSVKVTTIGVTLATTVVNATCHGFNDGSATVRPTAGVAPFTYTWSTFPVQTTSTATNLVAGGYTVTVTDNNGCSRQAAVTITDSAALLIAISATSDPTTCGGADGSITLNGIITPSTVYRVTYTVGGVRVTSNLVSSSTGTLPIPNLVQGTYDSITIVRGGCQYNVVGPIILRDPPLPAPPVLTSNSPVCLGNKIEIVATELTAGVTFFWSGPLGNNTTNDTDLVTPSSYGNAGMYVVTITKANCVVMDSIRINVIPLPLPTAANNSAICSGDTLKMSSLSLNGATSYLWHGPASFHSREQNPIIADAQSVQSGPYWVYITLNGCTDSAVTNVVVNQRPDAPVTVDAAYCQFDNVNALNVVGSGLLWYTDPVGGVAINPAPPVPSTLIHGTSTWYVSQSAAGCEGKRGKVNVTVYDKPNPRLDLLDTVICRGSQIALNAVNIGEANTGINWVFGNGDSIMNANPVMHSFDAAGTYIVTVHSYYKTCPTVSLSRPIVVFPYPDVYLGPDTAICPGGAPLILVDEMNKMNTRASWMWNNGETSSQLQVKKAGVYYSIVTINGCSSTDTVIVKNDCYMDMPNVFTPNGDGVNDYFYPRQYLTKGLISFKMDIYNRWGENIYQTNTTDGRGWDGTYNNIPQPQGVYIYKIDAVFKDGQQEHHQGNITLLR